MASKKVDWERLLENDAEEDACIERLRQCEKKTKPVVHKKGQENE